MIDGGLREFFESPATSWEPFAGGAEGEFVSTSTYLDADDRKVPHQFLPARGSRCGASRMSGRSRWALRRFDGAAARLSHSRPTCARPTSSGSAARRRCATPASTAGRACGSTARPAASTSASPTIDSTGLGDRAYRGETDPRKLPLVIAVGFGDDVLRINGIRHVRLQGLVLRGATGSPMIQVYGSENIELDHLTVFGGFPACS